MWLYGKVVIYMCTENVVYVVAYGSDCWCIMIMSCVRKCLLVHNNYVVVYGTPKAQKLTTSVLYSPS